ncbi:MAG: TIGR01212 family radical SAM protein [Ruminococcaceae bacterium]|nr:TIGR01212 family radical SAM protein [Oscillospiraceae bacterium]
MSYYKYSDYLKNKYGEKVYKLPISIPCTCPNRDGCLGTGGCIFCGDIATGFELLPNTVPVREQLKQNMDRIGKGYGAKKFIAYFQNFSNTYLPLNVLKQYLEEVNHPDVVQIALSTRPDCISKECLTVLKTFSDEHNIDIAIELGVQTVNYKTLKAINRGHSLAEVIDALMLINEFGFETGCHVILNLPGDTMEDTVETAKILSALRVDTVKLHSLYILKDSELGRMYKNGEITIISKEEYQERVITFLQYLNPDIAIQRLLARAPEGDALFCNWNTGWWKIKDEIDARMKQEGRKQGDDFHYLGGKAVKFHQTY